MKRVITVLGVVALLATASFESKGQISFLPQIIEALSSACISGGEGSTSCSLTVELGAEVVGSGGNVSVTYSTSCGAGYYSCCSITGASCERNE